MKKELNLWIPHQLKEIHLTAQHLRFAVETTVTGDEKWIVYKNVNRKRSWAMRDEPTQKTPKKDYTVSLVRL